jgi:Rieske Fe-S protein
VLRTMLENRKRRVVVFSMGGILALMIALTAAYAATPYNQDSGIVNCNNEGVAVIVKGQGNPIWVRARNAQGTMVIYDEFRTYSGTSTRYYQAPGAKNVEWLAFVSSGEAGAFINRDVTRGYCY